ncbi:MAG: STAS domain-containing protein [Cellulomonadaceae bacterium]|nr:STAS domain-containing protein [Cellulomonadaceae bacterium]
MDDLGSVHVIVDDGATRIVLVGEISAVVHQELVEAVADAVATGQTIEIDTHHVTFIDSACIAVLAGLANQNPHKPRLLHVSPTGRFILEANNHAHLFDIVDG